MSEPTTSLNYTEKKRPRASFGRRGGSIEMPYLLQMQKELYDEFLQKEVAHGKREPQGLHKAFTDLFPIESTNGLAEMTFHGYDLEDPLFTVRECKERNLTYSAKIMVHLRLHLRERENPEKVKEVREERKVYMGDIPLMTENGSFVINGTERVIVSQLHRAPGVYFMRDSSRQSTAQRINLQARMIPNAGSWLDLEFDSKELLHFRIDKRRKIYASLLLRALGYSIDDLIREFYDPETFDVSKQPDECGYHLVPEQLRGVTLPFDITDATVNPKKTGKKGDEPESKLEDAGDGMVKLKKDQGSGPTNKGTVIIKSNMRIKEGDLRRLDKSGVKTAMVPDSFITDSRRAYEDIHSIVHQLEPAGGARAAKTGVYWIVECDEGRYRFERAKDPEVDEPGDRLEVGKDGKAALRKEEQGKKSKADLKGLLSGKPKNAHGPVAVVEDGELAGIGGGRFDLAVNDLLEQVMDGDAEGVGAVRLAASKERLIAANEPITQEALDLLRSRGVATLRTIYGNEYDCGLHLANTIRAQENELQIRDVNHAREAIFRHIRPGDPAKPPEIVAKAFNDTFFNPHRIDLSKVGRMKINERLGHGVEVRPSKRDRHVHEPRPEMEWCVLASRSTKSKRMPGFDVIRAAIPAEQMGDEELELTIRDIKDEGPRVVAWHIANIDDAKAIAKAIRGTGLAAEAREQTVLSKEDIVNTVKMLVNLVNRRGHTDDIDSLGNRRIRMVGEFIQSEYESGLRRFHKAILDRMPQAESDNMKPSDFVNAKTIAQGVREFFNSNQLSQFMDQTNPLSEITHKRRVSALGVGGLQRDRAGFEVRDVHPTHYGRLCPIETPEGPNIGLINSFSLFSRTNEYGFITTPYRVVRSAKVTDEIAWLSAVEEEEHYIAQANVELKKDGSFADDLVSCRRSGEFTTARPEDIGFMDVAPAQIASVAAALIPFLEHDDSNRALMGSNMQRQAVPSLRPQKPLVGTGLESKVAADSGHVVRADRDGVVDSVDASRIVIRAAEPKPDEFGVDIYNLIKYMRSNQNTTINQRPVVKAGDRVSAGDIVADGSSTDTGELALGQNVLVAFMPWNGYNFEDSILVSERMVVDDRFTTVHIEEHVCKARDTRNGPEQITRDIPNQPDSSLAYLDEAGIIQIGTEVGPGDILVGKVSPKQESQQTPEEKLLRAIFGNKGEDVKDTSLRMPSGSTSTVIDVKVFTANADERDSRALKIIDQELRAYDTDLKAMLEIYRENADYERQRISQGKEVSKAVGGLKAGQKVTKTWWDKASAADRDKLQLRDEAAQTRLEAVQDRIKKREKELREDYKKQKQKLERNDDLASGVNKNIKVYLAIKRPLRIGDKMAGRHGNKGVVSKIVPVEDMPYLEDGTPVDLVLNLLGVPSRMNIGQILETHLGLAAKGLGDSIGEMLDKETKKSVAEMRAFLSKIYSRKGTSGGVDFGDFSDDELLEAARNLRDGVPFASPIFDGATEEDIEAMLKLAGKPLDGQVRLFDGRTGEPFERKVTVGHKYMFKLHHLVDEKMHARSTGSYSLVTQQPLGGKGQGGGQRLGEMEVWALEAYGAAYTLWEMLTVKSDDRAGRNRIYESICKGDISLEPGVPESYKVLKSELRALCIDYEEEY